MMARLALAVIGVWVLLSGLAAAHEVRPAYLEIVEEEAGAVYALTWKQPLIGDMRLRIDPVLPEDCVAVSEPEVQSTGAALVSRWRVRCAQTLKGRSVRIAGLERTLTSAVVRAAWGDGETSQAVARAAEPEAQLGAAGAALPAYVSLGVTHILGGFDHLAFVAGVVLIVAGWRRVLGALTAFTLAHSLTLAGSALTDASLPPTAVEAMIALSIVAVGYEGVRAARGRHGLTSRAPWLVAFGFGLLHGFGFAGALREIGLPDGQRLEALFLFNIGVELGQIAVVALLYPAIAWARRLAQPHRRRMETAAAYGLGGAGAFWLIERVAAAFA